MIRKKNYTAKYRHGAKTNRRPQNNGLFPRNKVIFVDVDGTLKQRGLLNKSLIEWCRAKKQEGFEIVLWSARGEEYARLFADANLVTDVFDKIISKPGYIVDDKGWSWVRFTGIFSLRNIDK